jgi:hypothetical protein
MHIGSEKGAPLVEFVVEEENPQELPPEGEGQAPDSFSECPNHRPSTFRWGKPRSIPLSLLSLF